MKPSDQSFTKRSGKLSFTVLFVLYSLVITIGLLFQTALYKKDGVTNITMKSEPAETIKFRIITPDDVPGLIFLQPVQLLPILSRHRRIRGVVNR